eukprot:1888691-Rhodomonas_salina.1
MPGTGIAYGYAMSGTDIAYAVTTRSWLTTGVLHPPIPLRAPYAMSGTCYAAVVLRAPHALPGTDIGYAAIVLRDPYGTDIGYAATRRISGSQPGTAPLGEFKAFF